MSRLGCFARTKNWSFICCFSPQFVFKIFGPRVNCGEKQQIELQFLVVFVTEVSHTWHSQSDILSWHVTICSHYHFICLEGRVCLESSPIVLPCFVCHTYPLGLKILFLDENPSIEILMEMGRRRNAFFTSKTCSMTIELFCLEEASLDVQVNAALVCSRGFFILWAGDTLVDQKGLKGLENKFEPFKPLSPFLNNDKSLQYLI